MNFPVGVAGKGNAGVSALVKETPGAICYVEYGYALQTGMPMVTLENKSGNFIKPSLEAGQAALASVELPANRRAWIPDPPAANAYPIVSYTWLLCYKKYDDAKILETLKSIINYGLTDGQKDSTGLGYIPLPASVIGQDQKALGEIS